MNECSTGARAHARILTLCALGFLTAACHDVVNSGGSAAFAVGGSVTGLVPGASVELANSDGDSVSVSADGVFAFGIPLPVGATYSVTVFQQPAGESCAVERGSGTMMGAGVVDVSVVCTPEMYRVSGAVSGLLPGRTLVLEVNGADATVVPADGAFSFTAGIASGANYSVMIRTQPDGQNCAVTNGSGTIGSADVLDVSVVCSDDTYNVGVTVSGVNAGGLTLLNDGANPLSISRNGGFNFGMPVASGSAYAVTVSSQPVGEVCTVADGVGTVVDANVGATVACVPNLYTVAGTLSGLYAGRSLEVLDNAGDPTTLTANGGFSFSARVASGSNYAVTVLTQPQGQTCAVAGGSGTVSGADVGNVSIACSDNTYNVGFTVSGLIDGGLVLQNNGTDNLAVSGNGAFYFDTPAPSGSNYSVTILTQPAHQICAVALGTGAVIGANITNIAVTCTGEWTWVGGSSANGAAGLYGTESTPASANVPGARFEAATFADSSGKFWLFGGYGYDSAGVSPGDLNDLWTYDPASGDWTWAGGSNLSGAAGAYGAQGTPAPANIPGARGQPAAWTDASGKFWLFGGFGYDSTGSRGPLNDLWQFDPRTGNWAWMAGAATVGALGSYGTQGSAGAGNVPGARTGAVSWVDAAGNLWLFGGQGNAAMGPGGYLSDLWEFTPGTGQWTWVGGMSTRNAAGSYGTLGTPAAGNNPGGRTSANAWVDSLGNLWLFGGFGYDSAGNFGYLNDLWEYSPAAGWAWMGGSPLSNGNSNYGALGIPSASNVPGGRNVATSWVDAAGNFWLFGGYGLDSSNSFGGAGNLGDLWEYSPATGLWTWIAGSNVAGSSGTYGTAGEPAFSNAPGGRQGSASWVDPVGNLWMLGGFGADASGSPGDLNDLWRYMP